jgi:hypothetical protein
LAQHRVWGKPYTVTEYDHPAPNQYAAEGLPLLAAHGALQDWDGLFAFDYGGSDGEGRIGAFFEQRTHPAKWALMRACAALFLRADVRPAQRLVCAPFPREAEMDALRQVWAWGLPDGRFAGLDGKAATMHRLATALEPAQVPRDALRPDAITIPDRRRVADTGELIWDRTQAGRGYFVVRAKRSKMAVGFIGGRTLDLGDKFRLQVQRRAAERLRRRGNHCAAGETHLARVDYHCQRRREHGLEPARLGRGAHHAGQPVGRLRRRGYSCRARR